MKNRKIVKKSNDLILSRFDLGEIEQKILMLCITQINKDDKEFIYKFPINEIDNSFVYHKDIKRLKQQSKRLQGRVVEIPQENPRDFQFITMITEIEYKDSILSVEFSKNIIPYLVDFKENFTKYHIKNIINLTSKYSIRFYELLRKDLFKVNNKRKFIIVNYELDYLFDMFLIPKSLRKISKFKEKILIPVNQEINNKTDVFFTYEFIKTGRKFTNIEFKINNNIDSKDKKFLLNSHYYKNKITEIEKWNDNEIIEHWDYIEYFYKNVIINNFIDKYFLIGNQELIFKDYKKGLFDNFILEFNKIKDKEKNKIEITTDGNIQNFQDLFIYLSSKII